MYFSLSLDLRAWVTPTICGHLAAVMLTQWTVIAVALRWVPHPTVGAIADGEWWDSTSLAGLRQSRGVLSVAMQTKTSRSVDLVCRSIDRSACTDFLPSGSPGAAAAGARSSPWVRKRSYVIHLVSFHPLYIQPLLTAPCSTALHCPLVSLPPTTSTGKHHPTTTPPPHALPLPAPHCPPSCAPPHSTPPCPVLPASYHLAPPFVPHHPAPSMW